LRSAAHCQLGENSPKTRDEISSGISLSCLSGNTHNVANLCAQAALHAIVETEGGLEKSQAAKYIADLKKAGRYLQDVW
jgi:hypothetical protein